MVILTKILTLKSSERRQLIDITREVVRFVQDGPVEEGTCTISVPHATAAIIANEHESGLMNDLLTKIDDLFPQSSRYAHNAIDDNADAHLAAAFLGHSRSFPVVKRGMVRGTWQSIFLVELDGPRSHREVCLQLMGE
jgi:secondary thiamine-phosphate synthase enzyme